MESHIRGVGLFLRLQAFLILFLAILLFLELRREPGEGFESLLMMAVIFLTLAAACYYSGRSLDCCSGFGAWVGCLANLVFALVMVPIGTMWRIEQLRAWASWMTVPIVMTIWLTLGNGRARIIMVHRADTPGPPPWRSYVFWFLLIASACQIAGFLVG